MGRLAVVLAYETNTEDGEKIDDVRIDLGGDAIRSPSFAPAGYDARALSGDYALTTSHPGDSRQAVVAYADSDNAHLASDGEVRIYSRNAGGTPLVWIWLKDDGVVRIENGSGYIELGAGGTMDVNGNFTVDP